MDSCFANKLNKLHISTSQNDHEIKKIDQIDKKIIHNQKILLSSFNIQNKFNLIVKIYSINKNIDEYTKLFIFLVLEYYNYSENHYLFINDVNDIPYFIENKYELPIIIEINLYETKSLKNIFNSIKNRNLDDVIPIIKNRNNNGNANLIAYSYIEFLLSSIELNQLQSNDIEINQIQKYYQYISDKIQNQLILMDEKDNIEEYFNQLFKKINMNNINNVQKVKNNYSLNKPHSYTIQKIIKKQITENIKQEELKNVKKESEHIEQQIQIKKESENIEQQIKNKKEYEHIEQQIQIIKEEQKSIKRQLQYKEEFIENGNYLEYTTIYADFENCGICMYCPSEPYEPTDEILTGPVINNETYEYLKNILYN
jgi:hypothetical protein